MKTAAKQKDELKRFVKKGGKMKMNTITYTWRPPTKEQLAAQEKAERQDERSKIREIAMFLEGAKQSHYDHRITHEHLSVIWRLAAKLESEIK